MLVRSLCWCVHVCFCAVGEDSVSMNSFLCKTKLLNCCSTLMPIPFAKTLDVMAVLQRLPMLSLQFILDCAQL